MRKLLIIILCLLLCSCGKDASEDKLYVDEVLPLYESIEVTEENMMEYFGLEEVEETDIFDEKTGNKNIVLKNKEGYFPELRDGVAVRVVYETSTIEYPEGSEKPEYTDYQYNESDIYLNGYEELIAVNYRVDNGYVFETNIKDFTIDKVKGKVIKYNSEEIDKLITVDESGDSNLKVWIDNLNCFVLEKDIIEDKDNFYKILYMNLTE